MQSMIQPLLVVALCLTINQGWDCMANSDKGDSVLSFLRHFNETRNSNVNPEAKRKARDFIISFFKQSGLDTWTEEFPSNDGDEYPGINVVGVIPGLHYGNNTDKIFMIATHYDTVHTSPGVDDNGSGMAALLQVIKQYTTEDRQSCSRRDYTMMFVAFDLEENQPGCKKNATVCGCRGIVCGSSHFVKNFTAFLNNTGSQLQGAIVMDTMMNYNTTPNSQNLPGAVQQVFPTIYQQVEENSRRGDFLAVIGRVEDDKHLLESFVEHYNATAEYRHIKIPLPFQGNPHDLPLPQQIAMGHFLRSDHSEFWRFNKKAIFLSDTANFRGYMIDCYHQTCDSMSHVTSETVGFLSKTADTLTSMAQDLSTIKDCGGLLNTTDKGELTSKYYPCSYPNKMDCVWTIYKPAKYRDEKNKLVLSVVGFQLENSRNCSADFLEITEIKEGTENSSAATAKKFCGSDITKTFTTEKGGFRVYFHSNSVKAEKGFKINWKIEMPTITSKAGVARAQFLCLAVSMLLFLTAAITTNL